MRSRSRSSEHTPREISAGCPRRDPRAQHIPALRISTPLAGERDEPLEGAVAAPQAREAVRQHAAGEEVPELLLHERRQRGAVGGAGGFREERLQMLTDDGVKDALLGRAGLVRRGRKSHISAVPRGRGRP